MSDFYSNRIRERLEDDSRLDRFKKAYETGDGLHLDPNVTWPKLTNAVFDRVPKCYVDFPPAPTMEELMIKHKLKPAKGRNTSRDRQSKDNEPT